MRKASYLSTAALALLLGGAAFSSCGNGGRSSTQDSLNQADKDGLAPDTSSFGRDTAPGAEMPPGAINPGEDSSRYGTGQQDTSKNRTMQK